MKKKVTKYVLSASLVGTLILAQVASPASAAWLETFDAVVAPVFDADFDGDVDVDNVDLFAWQGGFGTLAGAQKSDGDYDNDGIVDGPDFLGWQREFGASGLYTNDDLPGWNVLDDGFLGTTEQALSGSYSMKPKHLSHLATITRPVDPGDDTLLFSWYIKSGPISGPFNYIWAVDTLEDPDFGVCTGPQGCEPRPKQAINSGIGFRVDSRPSPLGLDTFDVEGLIGIAGGIVLDFNDLNLTHEQWYDGMIRTRPGEDLVDIAFKPSSASVWTEFNDLFFPDFDFNFVVVTGAESFEDTDGRVFFDNIGTAVTPPASTFGSSAKVAVPEPASVMLWLTAFTCSLTCRNLAVKNHQVARRLLHDS